MKFFTKCALAATLLSVSACGLIRDEVVVNGEVLSSAMLPGNIYVPVVNDGETTPIDQITGEGVPGFVGNSDGTVSQVLVRVSEDRSTAYVSVDGGPEREFPTRTSYYDSGSYFYGNYTDGTRTVYLNSDTNPDYAKYWSYYGSDGFGSGNYGLETPVDALTTDAATYGGSFAMSGETASMSGSMGMVLDFASGDIDGVFFGSFYSESLCCEEESSGSSGTVFGEIDGAISGSRVAGSAFATGGAEGTFDFMGGIYGETGNQVAGGIGGTLTTGTGDHAIGGQFSLNPGYYYYD
ncbi:hypothetical protein [Silicimonas sp. MF1-12-2]|uniref:hypothetical protein n=1 Tax=Silicimonas sp. MF1-12-2 TaxID=3384793 RepID=UPI0039B54EBC